MDHLESSSNVLLPFQAAQANLMFQAAGGLGGGQLPNVSAAATAAADQAEFDEAFLLHHEMLQDMSWAEGHDLGAACSPENAEMMSWGIGNVPLAHTTSNGGHSSGSSGNAPNSPGHPHSGSKKKNKAEERRARRRMQNRAAQRHFRDRRKVELKDNVEKIDRMESEIRGLSGENDKMEQMIRALRRKCEGLESERKLLGREKRILEGEVDGDGADAEVEAAEEIEKLVKGVMGEDAGTKEDECRWHWMKVKRRKVEERGDWSNVPSIFV